MASDSMVTLRHAANQYASSLSDEERGTAQAAIDRFVRWCGRDRSAQELTPLEIEQYGALVAAEGSDLTLKLVSVRSFLTYLKKKKLVQSSLATHLRLPKGKRAEAAAAARAAGPEVLLSAEGLANLDARLESLKEERVAVVGDIGRAMADKDFRENAPLDAAKERQSQIESTIRELEDTRARAVLRQAQAQETASIVQLGHTVKLKDLGSGKSTQYTLVDAAEADPASGRISSSSPVGRALLQKAVGEEVSVSVPKGTIVYRIVEVAGGN